MFSLEFNVMLLAIIIAAIIVYVLVLRKLKPGSGMIEYEPTKSLEISEPESVKIEVAPEVKSPEETKPKIVSELTTDCSHHFGYLRTLPRNVALPDECLGCSKILNCLEKFSTSRNRGKRK